MMEASESCNVLTAVVWRRWSLKNEQLLETRLLYLQLLFINLVVITPAMLWSVFLPVVIWWEQGRGGGLCPLWQPRHTGGWGEQRCAKVKHNSHFHSRVNSKWHKPGCSVGTCVADTQNNVGICCPDSGSSWAQTGSPVRFGGFVIALM